MNRLTKRLSNGVALLDCNNCELRKRHECEETSCRDQLIDRLAAYEDTGMSPKGCAQAAEANRLMEAFGLPVERIVELLKEEIHGRHVTLPCVPGDTLWLSRLFYTQPKKPLPALVHAIRFDADGIMIVAGKRRFASEAIGKTVFYTREEAERAMEGRKDG